MNDGLTGRPAHEIVNPMVNYNQRHLDLAFGALAHPIRRGILARLASGEATVAELARPFKVSAPAISKHMRILEEAGLLSRKKEGREYRCRLEQKRMKLAEGWIEHHRTFWNERLDALERYLKENP
jgi:DNA-binding transcriptional ArsR family regulator